MRDAYDLPGGMMLSVTMPNANSLTAGLTGEPSPNIHGTDPVGAAQDALAAYGPQARAASFPGMPNVDLGKIGRGVAFSLLAIILVALGVWVIYRQ